MDTKKLVGKRIKELRKLKKLSQEKLAEVIDIDPKHLSAIEVGRSFPSLVTLDKIVKHLEIDLKDVFDYPKSYTRSELRKSIMNMLKEADEAKLRLLIKLVRDVVR